MFTPIRIALIAASLVTGCGSVTPAGLVAAMRLDPLATPPGDITVAVSVPNTVRLTDGDAQFRLAFTPDDPTRAGSVDTTVPLTLIENATDAPTPPDGDAVYVWGFAPRDAARVAKAQAQITAARSNGLAGDGSVGVSIEGGCTTVPLGDTLPVSTWLKTGPDTGFVQLTRRTDLLTALPAAERSALLSKLTRC
ncbi:MAG: hypothetical protein AAFY65_06215 [Pseudomonadota bacterium]